MLVSLWGKRRLCVLLAECKLVQPLWKLVWRLLRKLKMDLPYDSALPFLGIYPKACKQTYKRDTCTPMFIAALFIIAKLSEPA
jgi:hypothetical protein